MDYIHGEKGNAEAGKLRLYSPEGNLDGSADIRAINGRGNSTWEDSVKKPYGLELSRKTDLLGMGAAKKWILLTNTFDASNINNKMVFDFAAKAGCAYTPECRWVDLYLNGEYAGLYLLSERNEVDPQRVDISEDGSFLVSMEMESRWAGRNYDAFLSRRGNFLRIHSAGAGTDVISKLWQSVEDGIFAEDGVDPATGKRWDELIDVDSWARQYLLLDVFVEYDAAALSKFFYYDSQKDRIFGGPVWDMDNILNQSGWHPAIILASGRRYIWNRDEESLFYKLYQKDSFRETVKRLYREEYRPLLLELAVILSVALTVGILLLEKLPVAKAPMILVVNADSLDAEGAVCQAVSRYAKHYSVKSRNVSASALDLVLELRTGEGSALVKAVSGLEGVQSVSLMSHDGEVSF